MKNNGSIKLKIYEIRRKKGISQEKIANKLGISVNSYRKLERGNTSFVSERLFEIADALEIKAEELILDDFEKGMSLADKERREYEETIEAMKEEISILKQHIVLLNERAATYIKNIK